MRSSHTSGRVVHAVVAREQSIGKTAAGLPASIWTGKGSGYSSTAVKNSRAYRQEGPYCSLARASRIVHLCVCVGTCYLLSVVNI